MAYRRKYIYITQIKQGSNSESVNPTLTISVLNKESDGDMISFCSWSSQCLTFSGQGGIEPECMLCMTRFLSNWKIYHPDKKLLLPWKFCLPIRQAYHESIYSMQVSYASIETMRYYLQYASCICQYRKKGETTIFISQEHVYGQSKCHIYDDVTFFFKSSLQNDLLVKKLKQAIKQYQLII